MGGLVIRPVAASDDIAAITALIRDAYAVHAAKDLRYWATHQPPEDTARRFAEGHGLVALTGDEIVGTVTVGRTRADSPVAIYAEPGTWLLSQFAVAPGRQCQGVGRRLHEAAVDHARQHGGRVMALDTALPAVKLIELYRRWGYRIVGEADWRPRTNYLSVVMARSIRGEE